MKITLSGEIGSGKSTVARKLASKLRYKYYSVGHLMRDMAIVRGLSIVELSRLAEQDKTIDAELDAKQIKIGHEEDEFVLDSRLGFHFVPDSFKIFLTVDTDEAARRILSDKREEEKYANAKEAVKFLRERAASEKKRYKEFYNIDFPNKKYFDLVLDTTIQKPDDIVEIIINKLLNR